MKNRQWLLFVVVVISLIGCNAYRPFNSKSEINDYLEEAQRCLHDGDFDCAISNYNALPDGAQKQEKLCLVYLSKGGMSLSDLVSVVNQSSNTMLGALAQSLVPWTAAKSDSIDLAKTHCADSSLTGTNTGVLLKALSLYSHCAIRMAKTDVYVATSNGDTNCNTAGDGDGRITSNDISDNSNGTISSRGMCSADVTTCATDLNGISNGELASAGLSDLENAFDALPAGSTSGTTTTARAALYVAASGN